MMINRHGFSTQSWKDAAAREGDAKLVPFVSIRGLSHFVKMKAMWPIRSHIDLAIAAYRRP